MKNYQVLIFFTIGFQCCSGNLDEQAENSEITTKHWITKISTNDSLAISGVKTIPLEVFENTELKYLSVWGQDCDVAGLECFAIKELPPQIKKLTHLEELHLTLNYITVLPSEILALKNLKILNLTDNPGFKDIQTVIQMQWLEEFYCYGCHLSEEDIKKLHVNLPNCIIHAA